MESFFTNKKIWKTIVIVLLFIMAIQIITPMTAVYADPDPEKEDVSNFDGSEGGDNVQWGGILIKPVLSFLLTIGDGAMYLMHSAIMGVNASLLFVNLHKGEILWTFLKDVVMGVIIGVTALVILTIAGPEMVIGAAALAVVGGLAGVPILTPVENTALATMTAVATLAGKSTPNELYLPIYSYSPEEIFKGKILLFNVNFFEDPITIEEKRKDGKLEYYYYEDSDSDTEIENKDGQMVKGYKTSQINSAAILKNTVSQWYVIIRDICIVGMLSVLIFVGIRMLLTSVSSEKAKYKEMLRDWFVGLCLLFVMHYIMAFSVTLVQKITDMISTSIDKNMYTVVLHADDGSSDGLGISGKKLDNLIKVIEDNGLQEICTDQNGNIVWATNLMGNLRLSLQFTKAAGQYIGELICFLILVFLTGMFTWAYFKRLLYMAFYTIIAPFVALTYCIDKINDGQAQGFNTWLREYIFNLLLQPIHLLIYYVLVTSAFDLAGTNVLYSIAVLMCMAPAEKLLRDLFGFKKAHTPPSLGGAMGLALVTQGIGKLAGGVIGGGKKSGKGLGANASKSLGEALGEAPTKTREAGNLGEYLAESSDTDESLAEELNELAELRKQTMAENGGQLSDEDREAYLQMEQDIARRSAALHKASQEPYTISTYIKDNASKFISDKKDWISSKYRGSKLERGASKIRTIGGRVGSVPIRFAQNVGGRIDDTMSNNAPNLWRAAKGTAANAAEKASFGVQVAGTLAKNTGKRMMKAAPGAIAGGIAGGMVGATTAGLGFAAGAASGDPSKAMTGFTAGAAAGMAAGRKAGEFEPENIIWPELREAIQEVNNSNPEYSENNMEDYIKRAKKDDDIWKQLEAMDKGTADQMRENGHFEEYLRRGYGTDRIGLGKMIAAEKLINDNSPLTSRVDNVDAATAVVETSERMGKAPKDMKEKDRKEWRSTHTKDYSAYGSRAEQMADQTMQLSQLYFDLLP